MRGNLWAPQAVSCFCEIMNGCCHHRFLSPRIRDRAYLEVSAALACEGSLGLQQQLSQERVRRLPNRCASWPLGLSRVRGDSPSFAQRCSALPAGASELASLQQACGLEEPFGWWTCSKLLPTGVSELGPLCWLLASCSSPALSPLLSRVLGMVGSGELQDFQVHPRMSTAGDVEDTRNGFLVKMNRHLAPTQGWGGESTCQVIQLFGG